MLYDIIGGMNKKRAAKGRRYGRMLMQFYQRLRDLREDADKTQSDIAAVLGTRQQQYARWESGAWQMPIEHYKTLARYYNVSLDYLAGLVDTPRPLHG